MRRLIFTFIGGAVLGTGAGFVIGIFLYPYIFLADIVAMEEVADAESKRVVATGAFVHVNPSDPIHYGAGTLTLYEDLVHLERDFAVGPGPKFHVYLVPAAPVTSASEVTGTVFVDLGRLKAFKGSQSFPIPPGVDLSKYGSVVIWCQEFGVLISPASLEFRS
ncbi:MAG: DM13 domain-containing protein [Kiloniellales bacterium]